MPEELQHLLERIQKDGVEKADAEAEKILNAARKEAEEIKNRARAEAVRMRKDAEKEAAAFQERGVKSVRQAARDTILSIGEAVTDIFRQYVQGDVTKAMTAEKLGPIVVDVIKAYAARADEDPSIEILLSESDREPVLESLKQELAAALMDDVEIRPTDDTKAGFRVSVSGSHVEHEFTPEAIADSLATLLRPTIAKIVKDAANELATKMDSPEA